MSDTPCECTPQIPGFDARAIRCSIRSPDSLLGTFNFLQDRGPPRTLMTSSDLITHLGLPIQFPAFFPPQLEQYRRSLSESTDTPDEYAVAYLLAAAASATGADVSACVQPGWYVRCNIFVALIGYKGSGKSTVADKALSPLVQREDELRDEAIRPSADCHSKPFDFDSHEEEDDYDLSYDVEEEEEEEEDDDFDEDHEDEYVYVEDEDEDEDDEDADDDDDDEDEDDEYEFGDGCGSPWRASGEEAAASGSPHRNAHRRPGPKQPDPCLVVNDCTGPALLQLLDQNRRQLLVNTDELTALFARNTGGTDRAMWCELFDGRRRRRERASTKAGSSTLTAPYVCLVGSIQPELMKCFYNSRGDDGLLDRLLLVGDGTVAPAQWPQDVDDPVLNGAWSKAISRLLRIEEYAADSLGPQVESRFTTAALEICKGLLNRLNNFVVVLNVPLAQRGIVKKLTQHAVKLALLHRCLRWAAGEFEDRGPLGDVDAEDATAACEAVLFFFGRWLLWRPELRGSGKPSMPGSLGLARGPGDDPMLQALAAAAVDAQRGIGIVERLIRLLRTYGPQPIAPMTLGASGVLADVSLDELQEACGWLVNQGYAEWLDADRKTLRLTRTLSGSSRPRMERVTVESAS